MTISAEVVLDSINPKGERITTLVLEYNRFIHSEFMTHRVFSRNASSSRAIPIMKAVKLVWANMAKPIHWGRKQKGMQANQEVGAFSRFFGKLIWTFTGYFVSLMVLLLRSVGVHKQVANRMLEPWTHIKVVLTATEFNNWESLRLHPDAQPEIQELARQIKKALDSSTPQELKWGEWHLPFVCEEDKKLPLEVQQKISASCAAQVSYRTLDSSPAKATDLYERLVGADVIHASPFEHPAKAVKGGGSGNFKPTCWRQLRWYLENKKKAS